MPVTGQLHEMTGSLEFDISDLSAGDQSALDTYEALMASEKPGGADDIAFAATVTASLSLVAENMKIAEEKNVALDEMSGSYIEMVTTAASGSIGIN